MKANRHLRIAVWYHMDPVRNFVLACLQRFPNSDASCYVVQYVVMPVATLISSVFAGRAHLPAKYVWLVPIAFSVAYLLYRLLTLSLCEQLLAHVAALPGFADFMAWVISSAIGLFIGIAWEKLRKHFQGESL